ncbi:extracellular solute-binding protein [Paenibacillus nasutitermitis]|uniref:Lipoprotein LipO n=1 Tax=Paenibacillus nasutitermitis TaxID=1652958 RepID=A0A917DN42_9BACL|nr:extracellular solute-binding protein [Paenibacillus nasutitermitis]GGD53523.1 lipoprotein LipO [Paenibacillus nasutitermitis]
MMKGKAFFKSGVFVLLFMIVLAGCGSKDNNNPPAPAADPGNTSTEEKAPEEAAPEAEQPIEISWIGAYIPGTDTLAQKYVEKRFNMKIKPIGIDRANWEQQLNIKLASNEKPDFFGNLDSRMDNFKTWVKQGIIGEIPVEKIREFAPKYSKMIDDADPTAWDVPVVDGINYGIPKIYAEGDSPFIPAYNEAWLTKIGFSEPPKTLEELEEVLTKFRNDDPDGNGKKDTYGISARGKDTLGSNQIFNTVFASHGITPSGWVLQADGKVQYGLTTEQARAAFKLLNKWYKAGIIDPEFVTDDWNAYRAKFVGNKTGMLDQALWYHDHSSGQVGMDAEKAGMKMVVGKPVIGPAGKMMGIAQGFKQVPFAIGADASKDPKKVEAILKMLETLATDEEAYLLTSYGEKGVHYDLAEGGGVVPKAEYTDPIQATSALGINFFNPTKGNNMLMLKWDYPAEKVDFRTQVNDKGITPITDAMQMKTLPAWDANKDALLKMAKEYELKLILGEVDTDKGFDAFVADMNKAGLEQATIEANEVYAASKK